MSEYRIDVKVRNNIILYKIEKAGYKNLSEFCKTNNGVNYYGNLVSVINMTLSPLDHKGNFRNCVVWIADQLGCSPEDLFSDIQMHNVLKSNKRSIAVDEAEMRFMLESVEQKQVLLESIVEEEQKAKAIDKMLDTITPRERRVIEKRMGLNGYHEHTLREIATIEGVQQERIRQIESKALRKLRSPHRVDLVKEFIEP